MSFKVFRKPIGRPPLPPEERLSVGVQIRVTADEVAALDGLRGKSGRSQFMRELLRREIKRSRP